MTDINVSSKSFSRLLKRLKPNQHSMLGTVVYASMRSWTIIAGLAIVAFFVALALLSLVWMPYNPVSSQTNADLLPPSSVHWLGTTNIGQDVFSQWMYGARSTLLVGALAATLSVMIGLSVGLVAGFVRWADNPLMRLTDVILTLPAVPLLITISAFVHPSELLVAFFIAILAWGGKARMVRSMTISFKKSPMIEVARMSGVPTRTILFSDILKHILPLVLAYSLFTVTAAILTEAALDFIGVGPITDYSWGAQIAFAQGGGAIFANAYWWYLTPGLSIAVLSLGLALVAYGLETAFKASGLT